MSIFLAFLALTYFVAKFLDDWLSVVGLSFEHAAQANKFLLDVAHLFDKLLEHIKFDFILSAVCQ